MPGVFRCDLTTRVRISTIVAHAAIGRIGRPAFPAPSFRRGRNVQAKTRAKTRGEIAGSYLTNPTPRPPLSSSAKADDPVFQRPPGLSRHAAAYWVPAFAGTTAAMFAGSDVRGKRGGAATARAGSNCPSSSATTTRRGKGGSNRPGSRSPAPRSGAARRRSTGSRISPGCCATTGW